MADPLKDFLSNTSDFFQKTPIGAIAGSLLNMGQQDSINQANRKEASRQRSWQEYMSNTAHQREVADLTAAGINPIHGVSGGGSSTPSGGQARMEAPQIDMASIFVPIQLDQEQQKINNQKALTASTMAKNLTTEELQKADTILKQKGMFRAEMEGKASRALMNMMPSLEKKQKQSEDTLESVFPHMQKP